MNCEFCNGVGRIIILKYNANRIYATNCNEVVDCPKCNGSGESK